jgi:predicted TIM-barrel fold metal-dependent hydrolase
MYQLTPRPLALIVLLTMANTPDAAVAATYTGPIIDAHAHLRLGDSDALLPTQPIGTDALRKLDDSAGIQQSALIVIAKKGEPENTRAQNDAVLAAAAASQNRFYAVVSVHPADGDGALAELDRVAKLGAKEVKLHPNTQNFDVADPSVDAVIEKCGQLGLVVLFDSYKPWDASEMGKFLLLAVNHPKTKLVLAHMGFSYFREAVSYSVISKYGLGQNVWFDISAIASTYADSPVQPELVWSMRKVGINRILFGSDWPLYSPKEAESAVRRLGLTADEQSRVFHDNAAQLLGLPSASK